MARTSTVQVFPGSHTFGAVELVLGLEWWLG